MSNNFAKQLIESGLGGIEDAWSELRVRDADFLRDKTRFQDDAEFSPLHQTARRGQTANVRFLLAQGFRPDALLFSGNTFFVTPLFLAMLRNHKAIVRILLQEPHFGAQLPHQKCRWFEESSAAQTVLEHCRKHCPHLESVFTEEAMKREEKRIGKAFRTVRDSVQSLPGRRRDLDRAREIWNMIELAGEELEARNRATGEKYRALKVKREKEIEELNEEIVRLQKALESAKTKKVQVQKSLEEISSESEVETQKNVLAAGANVDKLKEHNDFRSEAEMKRMETELERTSKLYAELVDSAKTLAEENGPKT